MNILRRWWIVFEKDTTCWSIYQLTDVWWDLMTQTPPSAPVESFPLENLPILSSKYILVSVSEAAQNYTELHRPASLSVSLWALSWRSSIDTSVNARTPLPVSSLSLLSRRQDYNPAIVFTQTPKRLCSWMWSAVCSDNWHSLRVCVKSIGTDDNIALTFTQADYHQIPSLIRP